MKDGSLCGCRLVLVFVAAYIREERERELLFLLQSEERERESERESARRERSSGLSFYYCSRLLYYHYTRDVESF